MPLRILTLTQESRQDYFKEALVKRGHRLAFARTAEEGLKVLAASRNDEKPFQLILVDEPGGANAASMVRELREVHDPLTTLVLSAANSVGDLMPLLTQPQIFVAAGGMDTDGLRGTIGGLVETVQAHERETSRLYAEALLKQNVVSAEMRLELENDGDKVPHAINFILAFLDRGGATEDELFKVKLGLTETLINSIAHGNLEMSSVEFKGQERNFDKWDREIKRRAAIEPYKDRRVRVDVTIRAGETIQVVVEDQGRGFDHRKVLDEGGGGGVFDSFGRGLKMVKAMCSLLEFNESGNRVLMRYDADPAA